MKGETFVNDHDEYVCGECGCHFTCDHCGADLPLRAPKTESKFIATEHWKRAMADVFADHGMPASAMWLDSIEQRAAALAEKERGSQ